MAKPKNDERAPDLYEPGTVHILTPEEFAALKEKGELRDDDEDDEDVDAELEETEELLGESDGDES